MEAWQRAQSIQLLHFVHRNCSRQCKAENPPACLLGEDPLGLGFPVQNDSRLWKTMHLAVLLPCYD